MILIENPLRTLQVKIVLSKFAPRQINKCLQICELYIVLRTLWILVIELVALLIEVSTHLVRPFL